MTGKKNRVHAMGLMRKQRAASARAPSDGAVALLSSLDSNIRQLKILSKKLGFMIEEVQECSTRERKF